LARPAAAPPERLTGALTLLDWSLGHAPDLFVRQVGGGGDCAQRDVCLVRRPDGVGEPDVRSLGVGCGVGDAVKVRLVTFSYAVCLPSVKEFSNFGHSTSSR
jgi:hypothetical protein